MTKKKFSLLVVSVLSLLSFQNCNKNTSFSESTLHATSEPAVDPTAVDPICDDLSNKTKFYPAPELPLKVPELDANCSNGFELNSLNRGTITLNSLQSSSGLHRAFIEVATYVAPDILKVTAVDSYGNQKTLFHTCRMQTADYSDPTGGRSRPPDDSIRQFRIVIPAGTKKLIINGSEATSPTYMKFVGLCDFNTTDSVVRATLSPTSASLNRYISVIH